MRSLRIKNSFSPGTKIRSRPHSFLEFCRSRRIAPATLLNVSTGRNFGHYYHMRAEPRGVMMKMSLLHSQITPVDTKNDMTAADLTGKGYKTLIVTTGTSGKGMGAAGTDVNKEIARCKEIIKAARDEGMVVITAHVEGMARRTDQADQDSIDEIIPLGDAILIITSSNPDGYFTKLSEDNNKPLIEAKDALAIGETIKALKK
jgi:hypothetical protein